MSTIFVALILIGFITAVCLLLVILDNKQKRKYRNRLLQRLSTEAVQNNLTFSSQEFINDGMIGLDGLHRRLLFLKRTGETQVDAIVISLDQVRKCAVQKQFALVNASNSKGQKGEQHLQKIMLRFELNEEKAPVDIVFFDHTTQSISLASELETKAGYWETLLSKMITAQKQRA